MCYMLLLLCVNYEYNFVMHIDHHALIPCAMEDGMQIENVPMQDPIAFRASEGGLVYDVSKQAAISAQGRLCRYSKF